MAGLTLNFPRLSPTPWASGVTRTRRNAEMLYLPPHCNLRDFLKVSRFLGGSRRAILILRNCSRRYTCFSGQSTRPSSVVILGAVSTLLITWGEKVPYSLRFPSLSYTNTYYCDTWRLHFQTCKSWTGFNLMPHFCYSFLFPSYKRADIAYHQNWNRCTIFKTSRCRDVVILSLISTLNISNITKFFQFCMIYTSTTSFSNSSVSLCLTLLLGECYKM